MIKGQRIVMDKGHYAGRPGIIHEVHGSKCTVILTDTPNWQTHPGVTIYNVKRSDYHRV